ncbi:MAG TPA: type II toxin-antitoxin system PemK/MazF family toxin [Thermoleophilia bacterium]|nr:type II toxin-antitoxin system PemK/MazF family toxin [Thermoleophilia bacterium]
MIQQGDIFWYDFDDPVVAGSKPAKSRPVIVVQLDALNESKLETVVVVPLTRNLDRADDLGNLLLRAADTGLDRDSVAVGCQVSVVNKEDLHGWVSRLDARLVDAVIASVQAVLGR